MKKELSRLNILHIFNDGFKASLLLFLPFIALDFGISLTEVGFLGSSVNIFEVLCALPAGVLAARFGGYKVLLGALAAYMFGYLLTAVSPNFYTIIPAFIVAGIGFGLFHPVAFALVTKLSTREDRGRYLGNFTAVGDVGRVGIAAVITFIITYIGWRYTALGSFLILLVIFGVLIAHFRSTLQEKVTKSIDSVQYKELLRNRRFMLASITYLIDCFASQSIFIFIPFLLLHRGVSPQFLGILTATFFVGNMLGKLTLGRLVDKFGSVKMFVLSEVIMALFILILSQSIYLPIIIAASTILGMVTKGTAPVLTSMVSESVEHHGRFEKAFSLNAVFAGIGTALSPLVLGFFADQWGIVSAFSFSAVAALVAIVPALMFGKSEVQK